MNIRAYVCSDEDKVVRLWIACGLVVSHNNPLRDIARKLRVNAEWFLVGEIDNQIVATCMAGYEGHRGWVNYLAVEPSRQRTKLASQIMERAEELLREAGCPKINLQIRSTNQQVIEFFQANKKFSYRNTPPESGLPDDPDTQEMQIHLDLYTLSFKEINDLWGSLGGKQVPFVMYKARLLPIKARVPNAPTEPIRKIHLDAGGVE